MSKGMTMTGILLLLLLNFPRWIHSQPQNANTPDRGEYFMLLIAVQEYKDTTIKNLSRPIEDAIRLRDILLRFYTFDSSNVVFLKNPDRDSIIKAFEELRQKISKKANLLIFYAGQGYWDKSLQEGFWFPSNASKKNRTDWLSNTEVQHLIREIKSKHTFLISDACFTTGLNERIDFRSDKSKELDMLPSRHAMTSGILNQIPEKSVFVECLVTQLNQNNERYLLSEELFIDLKQAVMHKSTTNEIPQHFTITETGDEGGDFIFIKQK